MTNIIEMAITLLLVWGLFWLSANGLWKKRMTAVERHVKREFPGIEIVSNNVSWRAWAWLPYRKQREGVVFHEVVIAGKQGPVSIVTDWWGRVIEIPILTFLRER